MTPEEHRVRAEELLKLSEKNVSANWPVLTGENKTDILLSSLIHAILSKGGPQL